MQGEGSTAERVCSASTAAAGHAAAHLNAALHRLEHVGGVGQLLVLALPHEQPHLGRRPGGGWAGEHQGKGWKLGHQGQPGNTEWNHHNGTTVLALTSRPAPLHTLTTSTPPQAPLPHLLLRVPGALDDAHVVHLGVLARRELHTRAWRCRWAVGGGSRPWRCGQSGPAASACLQLLPALNGPCTFPPPLAPRHTHAPQPCTHP